MKIFLQAVNALGFLTVCSAPPPASELQNKPYLVGQPCEGCEAVLEFGNDPLAAVDTLPDFKKSGLQIKVTGTIYQEDGKTPAQGVVLYLYHTNQAGLYAAAPNATGWAKRHGAIRSWVKTGRDGKYSFYTLKPGVYPDRSSPAHSRSWSPVVNTIGWKITISPAIRC